MAIDVKPTLFALGSADLINRKAIAKLRGGRNILSIKIFINEEDVIIGVVFILFPQNGQNKKFASSGFLQF